MESSSLDYSRYTILIVDDNPTNLSILFEYLSSYGFRILVAQDGETGIRRARQAHPDLILLDVMLPGLNGFETCERLKADVDPRDIPVIFMTALASTEDKVRGLQKGAVDYVTKPIQHEEVLARISTHLRIRDLTQSLREANAQILRFNRELEDKVRERTAELRKAYEQLERLDRKKSDLITLISHELRTPLTIFLGYAQILHQVEEVQQNRFLREVAEKIVTQAERLQALVQVMLEVSHIDQDFLSLSPVPLQLSALLAEVEEVYRAALAERHLTLRTEGLNSLPVIEADTEELRKVFDHLLSNAIKYTPDGGSITIQGRSFTQDGVPWVEIVVSDTGIGIEPGALELIFTKFYTSGEINLHSTSRTRFKGGGLGLGLTLARGVVEAHGGRIWAESPGYDETTCPGSRFYVWLPVYGRK